MTFQRLIASIGVGFFVAMEAAAGTIFGMTVTDSDGNVTGQSRLVVEDGKLRMDSDIVDDQAETSVIFDSNTDEMLILDHGKSEATLIDKATVDALAAQIADAKAQMDQALASAPPAQRAMMKSMMERQMGALMPPEVDIQKTSTTDSVAGYPCVKYIALEEGRMVEEYFVTDYANLQADEDVFAVLEDLGEFFSALTDGMDLPVATRNPFVELSEMDGFPVMTRSFSGNRLNQQTELVTIDVRAIDSSQFENPGYKVEKISSGRR